MRPAAGGISGAGSGSRNSRPDLPVMNVFVFDIETVPDVDGARRLWDLDGLDDGDVASVMFAKRQQETEGRSDFLRHHLHKIVAISAVFRGDDRLNVWSLGEETDGEAEIVARFFEGIERFSPVLVSWNGGGFDLPVLHYRALMRGVVAPRYWETGDEDRSFRYNNYLGRFHWRHIDLMDVIAGYQNRASAKLHELATMLGYPGKIGMTGADVWERYLNGEIGAIRAYCETDVLNTYLVYLTFERMRGQLLARQLDEEIARLRGYLQESEQPHFAEFLAAWPVQTDAR
jgi:predicted PolB exonuclease-like 3'-5' exonuclease